MLDSQSDRKPFTNGLKKHSKASKNTVSDCILKGEIAKKNLACGGLSIPPAENTQNGVLEPAAGDNFLGLVYS